MKKKDTKAKIRQRNYRENKKKKGLKKLDLWLPDYWFESYTRDELRMTIRTFLDGIKKEEKE